MKKLILNHWGIGLSLLLSTLILIFLFRESFSGLILQGVDDNISMRMMMLRSLKSGQGYHFFPVYWLGYIFNVPNPDLYTTFLSLTQSVRVVWMYGFAVLLSVGLTYALLRRLTLSKEASIFGALSYSFLPHVLSLVYSGHAPAISAIPMTPGFLLALTILIEDKILWKKILAAVWAGVFWSQMVLGEPQRGTYGTVLGAAWVLYLLFKNKTFSLTPPYIQQYFWKNLLPFFALVLLVGLTIFAPTFTFWSGSEFAAQKGTWEFSTSWSFPPTELMDSFAFGYHGLASNDPGAPYWGDKPLSGNSDSLGFFLMAFLIIGASLLWKRKTERDSLYFFFFAGLLALLLSFGKYIPGTPFFWLWYHLPGMNKVRVPAKFLSITALCWTVVAAMGVDAWKNLISAQDKDSEKIKTRLSYGLGIVLGVVSLYLALLFFTGGGDSTGISAVLQRNRSLINAALTMRLNAIINMVLLTASLFFIVLTSFKKIINAHLAFALLLLLTGLNLYQSNRFYAAKSYVSESESYPKTALIDYLLQTQTPQHRISGSLFVPNVQNNPEWPIGAVAESQLYAFNNYDLTYAFPYHNIHAFGRIPISRLDDGYKTFFRAPKESVGQFTQNSNIWEMNKRLWFMGNVDRILVDEQLKSVLGANLEQDAQWITNLEHLGKTVSIYKLNLSFPRFALVSGVKKADKLLPLEIMSANLKDLSSYQPVVEDNGILPINSDTTIYAPLVEQTAYNAYRIRLNQATERDQMFIFGDLYDSGWKAFVDSEPADITRANAVQQAFFVPKGATEVVLKYHKPVRGLFLSRLIILLALLAVLGAGLVSMLFPKKKNS